MKKSVVETIALDASAMLALIQNEPGADRVAAAMDDGTEVVVSPVNLCEVATKLVREGRSSSEVQIGLDPFLRYVVDFNFRQCVFAGELYRVTSPFGLSLGDRACIALAESMNAVVWTTDRAWKKLQLGIQIELIR